MKAVGIFLYSPYGIRQRLSLFPKTDDLIHLVGWFGAKEKMLIDNTRLGKLILTVGHRRGKTVINDVAVFSLAQNGEGNAATVG